MVDVDRENYQDIVQDLSGILAQPGTYDQVVWKLEYLSLHGWYHFYGLIRNGESSGIGHRYDSIRGEATNLSPDECISVALAFNTNASIVAYSGSKATSTAILEDAESEGAVDVDVIRVAIETRETEPSGRRVMSVTDTAFIGLPLPNQISSVKRLWVDRGPSLKWCRDRRFISSLPVFAKDAVGPT
ncbi:MULTISPECIES: hypothetical protein [Rhizobium]|uniref:hypothetical protein n=1 Tax=Rhizobium TaxID=379 RepID=UPI0028AA26C6